MSLIHFCFRNLVATRATPASTAHTLNGLIFLELGFGDAADAGRVEVCFFCLDAAEAAELFYKQTLASRQIMLDREREKKREESTFS